MHLCNWRSSSLMYRYGVQPFRDPESDEDQLRIFSDLVNEIDADLGDDVDTDPEIVDKKAKLHAIAEAIEERHGKVSEPNLGAIETLAMDAYEQGIEPILEARKNRDEDALRRVCKHSVVVKSKLRSEIQKIKARITSPEIQEAIDDIVPAYRAAEDIATSAVIVFSEDKEEMLARLMDKYRQAERGAGLGGL